MQVTGKCGSVQVRLIPAPRGTGIVSAPVPKKLLQMAGIEDCYTSARGSTGTLGNFGKILSGPGGIKNFSTGANEKVKWVLGKNIGQKNFGNTETKFLGNVW